MPTLRPNGGPWRWAVVGVTADFILPRSDDASARALRERDEAVRVALDNRAELTRTQQALAASQADLTTAQERHQILWRLERDACVKLRQRLLAVEAELASAQAELKKVRAQIHTPHHTEETTNAEA